MNRLENKIGSKDLIPEFYEMIKEDYPNLTEDQIKDIVTTPWNYAKKQIEHGHLPTVRFKYFGVFEVKLNRAKYQLKNLKKMFDLNRIDHKQYFKLKDMIENL